MIKYKQKELCLLHCIRRRFELQLAGARKMQLKRGRLSHKKWGPRLCSPLYISGIDESHFANSLVIGEIDVIEF